MLQNLRLLAVKSLIDLNEQILRYKLYKIYQSYFPNNINAVLDVGANKGQTLSFFLKLNPQCRITSFEPNKDLFQKLTEKYKELKNVNIYNLGISDAEGEKMFQENVLDYTSTFEELNQASNYLHYKARILGVNSNEIIKKTYVVKTTTLATFINQHIQEPIDVLKIDIEGHEYAALKGLFQEPVRQSIKYIQIEDHEDDMYINKIPFEMVKKLLFENGYEVKTIIKHNFAKINEVIFYNTALSV